jgi:hypothetical protein
MRFLTTDQKQRRVNVSEELRQIAPDDATFLSRVIAGDESWIFGYDPETKQQSSQRKVEEESREHAHPFLTSRGNSSWQAKQSFLHTTVTFYDDCMKMCEDFAPNFGDKGTGCCITTTYHVTLSL